MKQKDIAKDNLFSQKGQKIVAAIYLVTTHLSDSDPIKQTLRSLALSLVAGESTQSHTLESVEMRLQTLFGGAVLAGLISEKNTTIILAEVHYFVRGQHIESSEGSSVAPLFASAYQQHPTIRHIKDTVVADKEKNTQGQYQAQETIQKSDYKKTESFSKTQRQESIVSFITQRKSVGIKDIALLFPDVSEKTVQRELTSLVSDGVITKRGEKRWSVYMPAQN